VDGRRLRAGISIGIAVYNDDVESIDELNKCADIAMYHAKKTGRNTFHFFSDQMHAKALRHAQLKKDLGTAIQNQELFLLYQPQIDLHGKRISGFEALLRWRHQKFGETGPKEFIHLAEEKGLIDTIGEWVLKEACHNNQLLLENNSDAFHAIKMAVNVSPKQLRKRSFVGKIKQTIADAGISPGQLTIELTESMIMENPQTAKEILSRIRALGVRIAIDDFGTGYSSLSYLANLPVDIIKIDISFVQSIGKSKDHEAIIKTIIALAGNLGLEVVAEGVETASQSDFLMEHQCHIIQGYYYGKPVDQSTALKLIHKEIKMTDIWNRIKGSEQPGIAKT